ncbi:Uncharacterised protein [Burkholderia pseudomallei]|nr:Uncharacterised protein [Burkholderia pseudomallei]CAJ7166418.1 Uncharacterised protein [Burkholderia pseudomallei]CAJ9755717.1 Uncharacterised protein [Burkholderia pseudomallei]
MRAMRARRARRARRAIGGASSAPALGLQAEVSSRDASRSNAERPVGARFGFGFGFGFGFDSDSDSDSDFDFDLRPGSNVSRRRLPRFRPRRAAPLRRGAAAPPDRAVASSHLDTRARARAARMRAFAAMRVRMFVALARAGFTDVRAQPANIARPCTAPRDRAGCESAHQRAIDIEPHAGGEARRIGLPKARDRTLVACSRARIACAHARFISFVHRPLPAVRHRDRRRVQSACPPPCFGDTASATRLRYRFDTVSTRSGHRGRLTTGTVPARARPACDAGRARPRRAA